MNKFILLFAVHVIVRFRFYTYPRMLTNYRRYMIRRMTHLEYLAVMRYMVAPLWQLSVSSQHMVKSLTLNPYMILNPV